MSRVEMFEFFSPSVPQFILNRCKSTHFSRIDQHFYKKNGISVEKSCSRSKKSCTFVLHFRQITNTHIIQ